MQGWKFHIRYEITGSVSLMHIKTVSILLTDYGGTIVCCFGITTNAK